MADVNLGSHTTCGATKALCWRLGHACSTSAGQPGRHEEWGATPEGLAARCHLLEQWLAAPSRESQWRVRVTTGRTDRAQDGVPWTPDPAELSSLGLHPISVTPILYRWRISDKDDEAAVAEGVALLADMVGASGVTLLLIKEIVDAFYDTGRDVVRVATAGPQQLCLVSRYPTTGDLLCLDVSRSPDGPEWTDPACLIAGHRCPDAVMPDLAERARRELVVRGACAARILASALYLTPASYVSFELDAAAHELNLPMDNPDEADEALRSWWERRPEISLDTEREDHDDAQFDEDEPKFYWPLTQRIDRAAAGKLFGITPGGGPGRDRFPKKLGKVLFRDMVDAAIAYVSTDGEPPLLYTAGWAFGEDSNDIVDDGGWSSDEGASVLFLAGRHAIARIEMVCIM